MNDYDFIPIYRPRSSHNNADALSHLKCISKKSTIEKDVIA